MNECQITNLFIFTYATENSQVFIINPRQKEFIHFFQTAFSEDMFFPDTKIIGWWGEGRVLGGEDYGVEKITKTLPTTILVTSFDKFHHICKLYIFGVFCCGVI